MNTTTTRRITAAAAGVAGIAAVGAGFAGIANAGTLPVTHPGEPTIAMTITNHTNKTEHLLSTGTSGNGVVVSGARQTLAPGASETISVVAPHGTKLAATVAYRIGVGGPTATYEVLNSQANTNTGTTGVSGASAGQYRINHNFTSHYPNTNVGFDLW